MTACGNRDEEVIEPIESEPESNQQASSVMFRNVDVNVESEQFHIIGEVSTSGGFFNYYIEHDAEIIQEEEEVEVEESVDNWSSFEIVETLPNDVLESDMPPIVVLHGKNVDGEHINENYIPIDIQE